uniref:Uncharacterized protein n=1 Tax=Meloidogyne enterolobii TaxID=390850 RepID=A0A6V7UJR1_MELEN|nr:unnamed protein product [Meloidogyne enterolobii]
MSGTNEDSFCFPEFLEKENCLPASNSSTTSSVFESLNSVHLLQSTSQHLIGKIQKPEHLKCSYNPHNSGGRAISPIIESFGEDLDSNDSSSDKIVQNLVTRFENLFDYFERKQHQLNANWENFHKEMAKFNQQKIHEWAKMVDIRFGLQCDEYKAKAEKDFDKIKELELELIHAKIKLLEGEVNAIGKAFKEDNTKINDYSEILDSKEQENSGSQFVDEPVNLFNSHAYSTFNNLDTCLNQKFELPSEMVNTMYKLTERGKSYTFKNGNEEIVVTELCGCDNYYCLLYEYPNKLICGNEHSEKHNSKNFRWTTVPILPINNSDINKNKIEIIFQKNFYQIITTNGNIIKFCLSGSLEVSWNSGDQTIILPDGERYEFFDQETPDLNMEFYLSNGKALRSNRSTRWHKVEFIPNMARMSVRRDGSYSALCNKLNTESTPLNSAYLQINAPDFKLRRFNATKAVKIVIPVDSFPGASLEFALCIDNALVVKHVFKEKKICGQNKHDEYVCFSYGKCGIFEQQQY